MKKIAGNMLPGYWYNPRNGKATALDLVKNEAKQQFIPPRSGYGQDWVLVLFDASSKYKLRD